MAFLVLVPITIAITEVVEAVVVVAAVATTAYVGAEAVEAIVDKVKKDDYRPPSLYTPSTKEVKTIYDWWGHGLTGKEYQKLKDWGYDLRTECFSLEKLKSILRWEIKAPGKPTGKDGFKPKKGWDGETLVRAPKSHHKKGYPDDKGRVWVPTGEGSGDGSNGPHGGSHWDRVYPDGSHDNVYPGGKVRPGTH